MNRMNPKNGGEGASPSSKGQKPVSPQQIEELEVVVKKLGCRELIVYEERNGELFEWHYLWSVVEPLLSSGIQPTFTLFQEYPEGFEEIQVYVIKSIVIIRKLWHNNLGYSWSETKVSLWVRR
ncbi:MAG: hypothetical protein QXW98_04490 [Candidatus Caldarchaeum sp.]